MSRKASEKILLAHGGGGRLSANLLTKNILPNLNTENISELTDSASIELDSRSICFTTDSYVVKPLFFNGGDIGKLAVCGTINDLAVAGAKPVALSLSLIIAEGFDVDILEKILSSAGKTAKEAGVDIVTGDTKIVESDAADGIFINTAGVGTKLEKADLAFSRISPSDKIIINGTIGDHGMTIMSQREDIKFDSPLKSDCASLSDLTGKVIEKSGSGVKFMRDATRGGLAAVLNEIASSARADIELLEKELPINSTVRAAAEMLGFDLLNIANEGKVVIVASAETAKAVLDTCKKHTLGKDAAIIGEVTKKADEKTPVVEIVTAIGGRRMVQMPYGRELPRIC